MDTNKLFNQYCTNLYRVGDYAFTNKEDAQNYLEAHIKWELEGYSHGVIHIPLNKVYGYYSNHEEDFIDEMGSYVNISYDDEEYDSLSDAYYNEDPTLSSKDKSEIESWIESYNKLVDDITEVLDSSHVSISYTEDPGWGRRDHNFTITGTKSEVEQLYWAMYGDAAYVEQESLTYIDEIDEDDFEDPGDLDIDYKGDYFLLQ